MRTGSARASPAAAPSTHNWPSCHMAAENIPYISNITISVFTQLLICPRPQGQNSDQIKLDNFVLTRLGFILGKGQQRGRQREIGTGQTGRRSVGKKSDLI